MFIVKENGSTDLIFTETMNMVYHFCKNASLFGQGGKCQIKAKNKAKVTPTDPTQS